TFPNLYVLLVAPPGVGKQVIDDVWELWSGVSEPGSSDTVLHVAPDSMSKAALMDTLAASLRIRHHASGGPSSYHSLCVAAEEFSVMLPGYDLEYIGALNKIYNNPVKHSERRRAASVKELTIEFPQLNILAGVQPGWLGSVFPEEAWSTGLASRMIM